MAVDLKKYIQSKINDFANTVKQNAAVVPGSLTYNAINNIAVPAQKFVTADYSQSPVARFDPFAQAAAVSRMNPQQANQFRNQVDTVGSYLPKVPQIKINNPIGNFAANLPGNIVNSTINSIPNAALSLAKLPAARTWQQGAGDIATIAEAPLTLSTFGAAKGVVGGAGEQTLKKAVLTGAKSGAKYGAGFGLLGGFKSGVNINDPKQYAANLAVNTGTGAVTGAVAGGALAAGGYGIAKGGKEAVKLLKGEQGFARIPGSTNPDSTDIKAALKSGDITLDEAKALGFKPTVADLQVSRPKTQSQIEEAINNGDMAKAKELVKSLPKNDPYRKSIDSIIKIQDQAGPSSESNKFIADLEANKNNPYPGVPADQPPANPPGTPLNAQEQKASQTLGALQEEKSNKFNSIFNPLKNQTPDVQNSTIAWDRANKVSQVNANEVANSFKTGIDPKLEFKLVQYSQNPTPEVAQQLGLSPQDIQTNQFWLDKNRQFNDALFNEAKAKGVDLNYLLNHIYQQWKETPSQIDSILKGRGLSDLPGFANNRKIADIATGMELGLTPKYTTFGQINASAQQALDKAVANQQYANSIINSGSILPVSQMPADWEPITARFFPKANINVGEGQNVSMGYGAPPELAHFINNLFGGQSMSAADKIVGGAAKVSSTAQDIGLSGGVGPLNFYGIGQMIKEFTAGRLVHPLGAFFRSYSGDASKAFERDNIDVIKEMASQGIGERGVGNYQTLYKNVADSPSITSVLGNAWNKFVNEPTFGRFMYQLQVSFYKDAKNALMNQGYSPEEAVRIAADNTKNFYGITDANLGRSQSVNNLLTTFFLAPKFRESLVNIYSNMVRSINPANLTASEYSGIHRLMAGMAVTYGVYNLLQHQLTGKYMWDNPPGKEGELVIPVGDPKDNKYISIPWMPSITALPRRAIGAVVATAKGDVKEAATQAGGLLSIPMSRAVDLVRNQDYFGNTIIGDKTPALDLAAYTAGSFLPSYGKAATNLVTGKATPLMALSQALELPIKKGTFPNTYYTAQADALKGLTADEKKQAQFLFTPNSKNGPDAMTEAKMLLGSDNLLKAKQKVMVAANPNDALWTRPLEDVKGYLAYQASTDTQVKAQLRVAFPWIPQVQYALSTQFYNSQVQKNTPTAGYDPNSIQGKLGSLLNPATANNNPLPPKPTASPLQSLTPQQVKVVSAYTALPQGSPQRKTLLAQNPWLKSYWDANSQYYQNNPYTQTGPLADFLTSQGINPNPTTTNNYSSGSKYKIYPKKVSAPKIKVARRGKASRIKIKPLKFGKLNIKSKKKSLKSPMVKLLKV